MAVAITTPYKGIDAVFGNKRIKTRKLVFSGNYATGGESITAASLGLRTIDNVLSPGGVAHSTDLATSNAVAFKVADDHKSVTVVHYEAAAANTALAEKTNAEAHATGSTVRITVIGH